MNLRFLVDLAQDSLIPGGRDSPGLSRPAPDGGLAARRLMRTFIDVLRENAAEADRSVTFVRANGQERIVSYPELWLEARRRAHALAALGLEKGDRIGLILPEPDEFVLTFIAALAGGFVAVPIYPPQTLAKLEAYGD